MLAHLLPFLVYPFLSSCSKVADVSVSTSLFRLVIRSSQWEPASQVPTSTNSQNELIKRFRSLGPTSRGVAHNRFFLFLRFGVLWLSMLSIQEKGSGGQATYIGKGADGQTTTTTTTTTGSKWCGCVAVTRVR
ncbi:uncharacterized protein IWZ02DRAFT_463953 [Phyllosticta citriasiana]|uniref:Secreted protein n=1 Tax=Phyllosticta citriasiana TaxID=595635 RepID=A0ABR1KI27_9PEZI